LTDKATDMPRLLPDLRHALAAATASALVILVTGCAVVGPEYHEPAAAVPAQWTAPVPHGASRENLGDWWKQFNDPVLLKLQ
jgi:hypothetical protein